MDGELIVIIFAGLASIGVALMAKINGDKQEKKYLKSQEKLEKAQNDLLALTEENKNKADTIVKLQTTLQEKTQKLASSLVEETSLLSTLLLMDKYAVSKIRVVFTFDNPINKLPDGRGIKFRPADLEPSQVFISFK